MDRETKREGLRLFFDLFKDRQGPSGWKYGSLPAFVRSEGAELSAEPFTPDEEAYLLRVFRNMRMPKVKACFETAFELAFGGGLTYGEGYGVNDALPFPIEHAVGVLNGKPVDVSWRGDRNDNTRSPKKLLARAKRNLADNVYVMVSFPHDYVLKVAARTGVYGVIEGNRELPEFGAAAFTSKEELTVG